MRPLEDRFWEKIDKNGPILNSKLGRCWVWIAAKTENGYGRIGLGKRDDGVERAHRVSWILANGSIPNDLWVLHKCDNPECVRPEHLFLGNNTINMIDCVSKNRHRAITKSESY